MALFARCTMSVATGCGTRDRTLLTCPCHAWTYGLIGKPRKRLNFRGLDFVENFEDGSGDKLDLVEARCETWNDCIFVNVSGNAEPLADWQTGCSPCYNEQPTTIFPASAY